MTSHHQRRYDLDAMRIFAMLTIFFFHCARFFDPFGWHLKNAETSDILSVFVGFISMTSFVLIIALYEFLIKRINALRFLFGMRPKSGLH